MTPYVRPWVNHRTCQLDARSRPICTAGRAPSVLLGVDRDSANPVSLVGEEFISILGLEKNASDSLVSPLGGCLNGKQGLRCYLFSMICLFGILIAPCPNRKDAL
jgi:hypothetical protein